MLWLGNGKKSFNLEAREVHIYKTGKTPTTNPPKQQQVSILEFLAMAF